MKSREVYRLLHGIVGPWCKAMGFARGRSLLSYHRPAGAGHEMFWFQCSQSGWDPHAGSKFTLELQWASEPVLGAYASQRERFGRLMSGDELEQVRFLQNVVIRDLVPPPADHWIHTAESGLRAHYLSSFARDHEPYGPRDDVWLRYASEADVRRGGPSFCRCCRRYWRGWPSERRGSSAPF